MGRRALEATDVVPEAELIAFVTRAFGITQWPSQPLVVSATDTEEGTSWLFDRAQDVPIERAVAASIAIPVVDAPVTVGERRYMDGGVSSSTHFEAVGGFPCVVGVTPGGGAGADREVATLQARGSQVLRIVPDAEASAARGPNLADQTRRWMSAEAGYRQAATLVEELREFWNGRSGSD